MTTDNTACTFPTVPRITFVGAGNLATQLGKALVRAGCLIPQVYSRTMRSAAMLASQTGAQPVDDIAALSADTDLLVVAVTDKVLPTLLPQLQKQLPGIMTVHTAGSIPLSVFGDGAARCGVFYPMQTFSKSRDVDFSHIPIFIEATEPPTEQWLLQLAERVGGRGYRLDSSRRRLLHLSAVFACNFSNHCYALAETVLAPHGIPFDVLLPLIDETAAKVHNLSPHAAQTGPAVRYDENVMAAQEALLADLPRVQEVYRLLSRSIHEEAVRAEEAAHSQE